MTQNIEFIALILANKCDKCIDAFEIFNLLLPSGKM